MVFLLALSCSAFITKIILLKISWLVAKATQGLRLVYLHSYNPSRAWLMGSRNCWKHFPTHLCLCLLRKVGNQGFHVLFHRNLLHWLSVVVQICHFPPGSLRVVLSLIPLVVLPSSPWTGDVTLLIYSEVRSWWHFFTCATWWEGKNVFPQRCTLCLWHKSCL